MKKIAVFLKSKKVEFAVLIFILLAGFAVRLYKIDNPLADWHSWRQSDTAAVGRIYLDEGISFLFPKYYDISRIQTGILNFEGLRLVEFPVFNALHAILAKAFPQIGFEIWGRLISITSSLVSALFLYLIGKRLMGKAVGLLSAFFFLFIPYNIYFSRVILPEPMAVAFGLVSIYLFVLYIEEDQKIALYASGLFLALSTLVKPFTFFYGIPLLYLAIKKYGVKSFFTTRKELLLFAKIAIVPFFLWRIWINQYPAGIPHFGWAFNGDGIRGRPAFWRWIFGERIGHLILGVWGLIPFSFGLLNIQRKNLFSHFFLLGVALYLFVFATASVRHDYYQIFVIPAISLITASGSVYLWQEQKFNVYLRRGLLLFSLLIMFVVAGTQVREFYKINHPEILEAGAAIDRLTPKEAWVIAPYNGDTAFLYQTKRFGWPVVDEKIEKMIERGADYFVTVNWADPDTKYVEERYEVVAKTEKYLIVDLAKKKR